MHAPLSLSVACIRYFSKRTVMQQRATFVVDFLESRLVLSTTIVAPLPLQTVPENTPTSIDLAPHVIDTAYPGTVVQMVTNQGIIDLELFDTVAPGTVANFLQYVNDGLYNNTIIHRVFNDLANSPPFQVVQGGGFDATGAPIQNFGPIPNEFSQSNIRGTIAMAKVSNSPNSASNQWFINDSTNPFLDTSDGGFTVFGKVIAGMNVVDAIDGLPTIDGTSLNPQFGTTLPVITTPAAGAGIPAADLVNVRTASVIPNVQFSATSDNLQLVNPTINGTQLMLNPAPGRSGFCDVTVRATGLSGDTVSERILVEVAPSVARSLDVTLGGTQPRSVSYRASDGTRATITLGGPGSEIVRFAGDGLHLMRTDGLHVVGNNVEVYGIDATGTTASSSQHVTVKGKRFRTITIGPVTTTGAFGSLIMRKTLVDGGISAPMGLGSVNVDFINNGSVISGAALRPGHLLSAKGVVWTDVNLTSAAPISSIIVSTWNNGDTLSESVQAPYVRRVQSRGNFTPGLQLNGAGAPNAHSVGALSIRGYIGGTWSFPGRFSSLNVGGAESDFNATFAAPLNSLTTKGNFSGVLTAPSIGSVRVGGSMTTASFILTTAAAAGKTDLGNLSVKGSITSSTINSAGNIGIVSAESLSLSTIYAGVGTLAPGVLLPTTLADFPAAASIGSITLHPRPHDAGFSNSDIAAKVLGAFSFASVTVSNGGNKFGVAGTSLQSLTAQDKVHHVSLVFNNITTQAQVDAVVAAKHLTLQDLTIALISQ